jgi:glucose/mannose-6-phosphate isomerase
MEEAIIGLPEQFNFKPEIKNIDNFSNNHERVTVIGMGGSHLCAGILKAINPSLSLTIHNSYGVPKVPENLKKKTLLVFISYSGNTEEVLESLEIAHKKNYSTAVITTGGKLEQLAEKLSLTRIIIPNTGIQPRNAVGFSTVSLATLLNDNLSLQELSLLSNSLKPGIEKEKGLSLAKDLLGFIPIIYSSLENSIIAYNWKIKFNETTKIPAFYNIFPELNHNEMEGFGVTEKTENLSSLFRVCFLKDSADHSRVKKRMEITESIYKEKRIKTSSIKLEGESKSEKIFRGLLIADWLTLELALSHYKTDADKVPVIEKFKRLMEQ